MVYLVNNVATAAVVFVVVASATDEVDAVAQASEALKAKLLADAAVEPDTEEAALIIEGRADLWSVDNLVPTEVATALAVV
jgi:hypothetical protein